MRRVFAVCLMLALLAGCGTGPAAGPSAPPPTVEGDPVPTGDLMGAVTAQTPQTDGALTDQGAAALTDLGVRLLQNCLGEGSTLVSPLSVLEALGMTANGASGQTLAQMEKVLGFSAEELNDALYLYVQGLPDGDGGRVHVANGVWMNAAGGFRPEQAFLQTNADYYGAALRQTAFGPAVAEEINGWVADNTAGRIEKIIDEVPEEAMAYLVNALSFDAKWEDVYREDQVRPGTFTAASGREQEAQFMWSTELGYLRDGDASGFVKYYQDRGYAFAALLPGEGTSVEEYVASLSGEKLHSILAAADGSVFVEAAIPQFTAEYAADLTTPLAAMGMADAFDPDRADFSRMGSCDAGRLYISRVLHKTFIRVDEKGTEAGAATAVEMAGASAMGPVEQVVLDRPFVYMLIDCQNCVPLFLGTVTELE